MRSCWEVKEEEARDHQEAQPHLDPFVVCKSRRFLGPFQLDGSDELLEMKPDDLCIIHYKSIRERVQEGEIDLV
ncbi:hypothetical protein I3843_16G094300 [Carya illinoinensis]|nr:hypothetical protein I3843_16G094300 [Carya illinoinensis]